MFPLLIRTTVRPPMPPHFPLKLPSDLSLGPLDLKEWTEGITQFFFPPHQTFVLSLIPRQSVLGGINGCDYANPPPPRSTLSFSRRGDPLYSLPLPNTVPGWVSGSISVHPHSPFCLWKPFREIWRGFPFSPVGNPLSGHGGLWVHRNSTTFPFPGFSQPFTPQGFTFFLFPAPRHCFPCIEMLDFVNPPT